jgi:hypothetical protein
LVITLFGGDFAFAPPYALDAKLFHEPFNSTASKLW